MEEGVLVRWTKKEGDKVSPGDLVAEVETDKANMDFNIEDDGVLLKLLVKEGDTVKLGAPVAIIGKAGEDVAALVEQAKKQSSGSPPAAPAAKGPETATSAPAAKKETPAQKAPPPAAKAPPPAPKVAPPKVAPAKVAPAKAAPEAKAAPAGKLLASPLAKTLAIELGIDLRGVTGSGPGGRIVERDVRAAAEGGGGNGHAPTRAEGLETTAVEYEEPAQETAIAVRTARQMVPDTEGDYTDVPASNMRKRIAARLTEAKRDVPHFYLQRQIDAAPMLGFRERLNALLGDKGKVSVNDLVIKAVALALRRVPACNASWENDAIRQFHRVHVGVAVALDEGLVTPVIRDADQKGIGAIAAEVRDLASRAKTKQLKGHEITGSTFSVSNLGMMGIERFTAIINPPEGGILAVGAVLDVPVVKDGQVVAGKRMSVSMSCDHRVIDGALGAKWLQAFAELIEHPESLAL
jgi:pyruvate dehydrogenase E2 component (dihydrolipoamide acetyltransferase)